MCFMLKDIQSYCLETDRVVPFPIIADPNRQLAVALDMIDEEQINDPEIAQTVRAMYVIDPSHRMRLSMLYPMSTGRSIGWVKINEFQTRWKNVHISVCKMAKLTERLRSQSKKFNIFFRTLILKRAKSLQINSTFFLSFAIIIFLH